MIICIPFKGKFPVFYHVVPLPLPSRNLISRIFFANRRKLTPVVDLI